MVIRTILAPWDPKLFSPPKSQSEETDVSAKLPPEGTTDTSTRASTASCKRGHESDEDPGAERGLHLAPESNKSVTSISKTHLKDSNSKIYQNSTERPLKTIKKYRLVIKHYSSTMIKS